PSVPKRPDLRRPVTARPQPGSASGRASYREGPPPPPPAAVPPGRKGGTPQIEPGPAGDVLQGTPVTVTASAGEGPPAPGGTTRREGALEPTSLEDKLLQRGVISREDWLEIKAEEERKMADRTEALEFTGSPRWYERIRLYGYFMFRYNQLGHPN